MRTTILNAGLHYDRRKDGPRGRCLMKDIDGLGLKADDRLEPSQTLPDIAGFESAPVGTDLRFWRQKDDTIARHKNPYFLQRLGLSPAKTLCVDALHTLNLGVYKNWGKLAIWCLLLSGIYAAVGNAEEHLVVALLVMRNALNVFYNSPEGKGYTRIHALAPKMIGTRNDKQLKTKGAETWGILKFLVMQLAVHGARLGHEGRTLHEAGCCLAQMQTIFNKAGMTIPQRQTQLGFELYSKFMVLMEPYDAFTPKHHMVYHLLGNLAFFGNPRLYSTWFDESLNKLFKRVCKDTNQYNFEKAILLRMRRLLNEPNYISKPC